MAPNGGGIESLSLNSETLVAMCLDGPTGKKSEIKLEGGARVIVNTMICPSKPLPLSCGGGACLVIEVRLPTLVNPGAGGHGPGSGGKMK